MSFIQIPQGKLHIDHCSLVQLDYAMAYIIYGKEISIYEAEGLYCVKTHRTKDDNIGIPYRPTSEMLDGAALVDMFKVSTMWSERHATWMAACSLNFSKHQIADPTWLIAIVKVILLAHFPDMMVTVPLFE